MFPFFRTLHRDELCKAGQWRRYNSGENKQTAPTINKSLISVTLQLKETHQPMQHKHFNKEIRSQQLQQVLLTGLTTCQIIAVTHSF